MKEDPKLTDEQAEQVKGGVGAGPGPGAGVNGWFGGPSDGTNGLINAGYTPPGEEIDTGNSGQRVVGPGER
jgi:hypothetical protein